VQGGYTNPNRTNLGGDLRDDADSREQVSLKDALHLLAKQGKTGTLVSDGCNKSCAKRPMWNCLLHTSMGVFLIEICDTSYWRLDMSDEETKKGDRIAQKLVHHIEKINGMAGAEVIDQVVTDSPEIAHSLSKAESPWAAERAPKLVRVHYSLRLRRKRGKPEYEDVHLPAMALDPIEEPAGTISNLTNLK
jgi:hypothetical protein